MRNLPIPLKYIVLKVEDTDLDLDYGSCFYEGDIPSSQLTSIHLKQIPLKELLDDVLKGFSKKELDQFGLQRKPKS
jgi:hypothetical protein